MERLARRREALDGADASGGQLGREDRSSIGATETDVRRVRVVAELDAVDLPAVRVEDADAVIHRAGAVKPAVHVEGEPVARGLARQLLDPPVGLAGLAVDPQESASLDDQKAALG